MGLRRIARVSARIRIASSPARWMGAAALRSSVSMFNRTAV